jgi:aconitate hydratase
LPSPAVSPRRISVAGDDFWIYPIDLCAEAESLPFCLKVLLEGLLRADHAEASIESAYVLARWDAAAPATGEIPFSPARVVMQDLSGVPAIVDLAAMRDAMKAMGGDPNRINPLVPVDLVIDHSLSADVFGSPDAHRVNVELEYQRNRERYQLLRWAQSTFAGFRVVPPGAGIVHQVNLEHLATVVTSAQYEGKTVAYPDTCVGTDSHTTMINGLGVLGWGVGGIEADAAILGQPISIPVPPVVGFELTGELPRLTTATDLVLTITNMLRAHGVVGKFIEFYGSGVGAVPVENRATIGNMSPEFGSTAAVFPIDAETLRYLSITGRNRRHIMLVEAYAKEQGLWHDPGTIPRYSERLELDLSSVSPSIAGPKRPQDRISLADVKSSFRSALSAYTGDSQRRPVPVKFGDGAKVALNDGAVAIAAITSCTNTSNPSVMIGAGLLARNAVQRGLKRKPWVKTTLAPGSRAVTEYLDRAGLTSYLEALGFYLVGYGCTTCSGNSGPLIPEVGAAVEDDGLVLAAVLSGNRNFEGRINPDIRLSYLASPPLVVAYAIAGSMDFDPLNESLGQDSAGQDVYLADIWPSPAEVAAIVGRGLSAELFSHVYEDVFTGAQKWRDLSTPTGSTFVWDDASTYVRRAPYFDVMPMRHDPVKDIHHARVLVKLGDSVTTDDISPAGAIRRDSPAARYLFDQGVAPRDFNSYGSRRGNHELMVRGTFANIRLHNQLVPGKEGGWTRNFLAGGQITSIYEASVAYAAAGVPLLVIGGKEYGSGSSRDWAAKGTRLLGVRAVLAESYERIHRSNLVGMGVLPLQFLEGQSAEYLQLSGEEMFEIVGSDAMNSGLPPYLVHIKASGYRGDIEFDAAVRVDTSIELAYYRHGGIMPYVLRGFLGHDSTQ